MGNQPSTTNHNKLSKPRTNTNSVAITHNPDSPSPASSRPADLSAEGRQQIKDALLSPVADELGSAIWAQNDSAVEATKTRDPSFSTASRPNSRSHSRSHSRSNSLSCFGSKHGSTARLAGMADSDLSLVSPSHVDIAEAIRLLQQVKKNGSPEDLAALQEVLEAPEEPAVPVAEPDISRRESVIDRSSSSLTRTAIDRSSSLLTRRRSLLQTPGVGTRNSPIEGRRRTWNSWKAPKLEPGEEVKWQSSSASATGLSSRAALIPTPNTHDTSRPRASTPSELDYSHLGNLQLGSLVVTNGAASPASSVKTARPRHVEDEDYFSEAELGSSPLMMKPTRRRGHSKSKSASLPVTSPLHTVDTNEVPELYDNSIPTPFLVKATPSLDNAQSTLPGRWDDGWQDAKSNTNSAAILAQTYQADIPLSPFLVSEENLAVSKEEGLTPGDTDLPKTQVARSFHHSTYDRLVPQVEMKVSAPSIISRTPTPEKPMNRTGRRPSPHTTDSGYSSGSSRRVTKREQQTSPGAILCHQRDGLRQDSDANHDNQPCQPSFPKQSPEISPTLATAQLLQLDGQRRSLTVSTDSASSSARPSTSEALLSPQMAKIVSRASWADTTEKSRKRFHRRKSLAERVVVQSCQSIPEGTIPAVPTKVRAEFERRVSSSPGMDCLTQTYPTKNHIVAENSNPEAPLSSWSEFKLLAELEPEGPSRPPPMHGRRKSLSFFRRKSISQEKALKKEYESAPVDGAFLGLVAASIGDSPYDPTVAGLPKQTVESPTHPCQLGGSVPRSKSMVNTSSKAAVEFARACSQDVVVTKQALPPQQRRGCHNLKMEAGEAKASKRRPQNFNVPPVPSIDTSKLLALSTAKPRGGPGPEKQRPKESGSGHSPSPTARAYQGSQTASQLVGKDESRPPRPQHGVGCKSVEQTLRPSNAAAKTNQSLVDLRMKSRVQRV